MRSPFMRLVRRVRRASLLCTRDGIDLPTAFARVQRRDLLKAASVLALAPTLAACPGRGLGVVPPAKSARVAVVGAGLAGLHCAVRLNEFGIRATVYEAQTRTGGRAFTDRATFAAQDGQHCELGGELIDSGHSTMRELCAGYGLELLDYTNDDADLDTIVAFFDDANVDVATLLAAYAPIAARIAQDASDADADAGSYAALDAMSIRDWFDALVNAGVIAADNIARRLFEVAYTIEYGREVHEQSALNMLYLAGTDTNELALFGESDELFHIQDGTDALASALAADVDGQIHTGKVLTAIASDGDVHTLTFADGTSALFDHVVVALPFSVLREVDLSAAAISDDKRDVIDTLGYGTNAKLMLGFDERVWRTQHHSNGESYADLAYQATWETSRLQPGTAGILTNFTGGLSGLAMGDGTPDDAATRALEQLERVYAGLGARYNQRVARFYWPTNAFVKASYSCYLPGQWLAVSGSEGLAEGTLYFCGEHTSTIAQGYLEGAVESGARCAVEVSDAVGGAQALRADTTHARIVTAARKRLRPTRQRKRVLG